VGPMPTNEVHYRPTRRSMSSDGAWSIPSQSFGRPASENPLCTRFAEQATGGGGSNTSASLTSGGASQRCGVLYDPSATVGAAHRSPVRRRTYAHTKARHALVHLVCRPGKVIQTGGLLGTAARVVRRSGGGPEARAGWWRAGSSRTSRNTPSPTGSSGGLWAFAAWGKASTARATPSTIRRGCVGCSRTSPY
jgi:hypothetical protein